MLNQNKLNFFYSTLTTQIFFTKKPKKKKFKARSLLIKQVIYCIVNLIPKNLLVVCFINICILSFLYLLLSKHINLLSLNPRRVYFNRFIEQNNSKKEEEEKKITLTIFQGRPKQARDNRYKKSISTAMVNRHKGLNS